MKPNPKQAFTLVELLVVVAIIAVLAALLLPAMKTAKDRVKSTSCVNNIRQFGSGLNAFLADNDNWYPYANPTGTNGLVKRPWNWQLGPYVGGTNSLQAARLFYCPANPWKVPKATLSSGGPAWYSGTAPTLYGLNTYILPSDWLGGPFVSRMKPSDFPYLGQMMLTGETPYSFGEDAFGHTVYAMGDAPWEMDGGNGGLAYTPFCGGVYDSLWVLPDIVVSAWNNGHPQLRVNHNLAWNSLMGDGRVDRVTKTQLFKNNGILCNNTGSLPLWNGGLYTVAGNIMKNQKFINCPYPY